VSAKLGDYANMSKQAKADEDNDKSQDSKASPGSFGFSLAPISPEARQQLGIKDGIKGALIASVESGSPAEDQGLRAGDIIQQVGQHSVDGPKDAAAKLKEAKETKKPVLMKVYREGSTRFVAVSPRAS
jgi:serine protease Do